MTALKEATQDFLAQRRIAVAGVSRDPKQAANLVYRRLRDRGYTVFAVNPNADELEGNRCYHDLGSIPDGVDAVVVATSPAAAEDVVRQCEELGVGRVWFHRSFGRGSVSEQAVAYCREHGIRAIPGGCPCMFEPTADRGHAFMRRLLALTGGLPRHV
jgi:predicted CoA-binding protein